MVDLVNVFNELPQDAHIEVACDKGSLTMYLYVKQTGDKHTLAQFENMPAKALFFQIYNEMCRLVDECNRGRCGGKKDVDATKKT